jgi:hypothetical protein
MEQQYHTLYDHGVQSYRRGNLDHLGIPDKTAETLVHWGMPEFDLQEPPLGLLFHEAIPLQDVHGDYIAVGREIKRDTGVIWAVT